MKHFDSFEFSRGRSIWAMLFALLFTQSVFSQFTDVSISAGINLEHTGDEANEPPPMGSVFGSGAAWFDYNNDGWLDLYVTMRAGANKLYRNEGDGTFTEVAAMLGVADATNDGAGASAADYNNDGWVDLYLANGSEDKLFKNNNGTSFTDVTQSAGLNWEVFGTSRGTSATWGDYDQDGYLDLYVAHHVPVGFQNVNFRADRLYHNDGDGTFTDVSSLIMMQGRMAATFISSWTDIDNDCDLDIIQITDCPVMMVTEPVRIYRNDGGTDPLNWTFTEVANQLGVNDCKNGMGIAVGDLDHNGYMDFYFSNIGPTTLYKNYNGSFTDATTNVLGAQTNLDWSWGTCFFDYDLDGWLDIYLAMGNPRPTAPSDNQLFRNDGSGTTFTDVSAAQNMGDLGRAHNVIYGDYDNDGDLDIFIVNYSEVCRLMRNDNNTGNNWIKVKLEGDQANKQGIGARVKITTPDGDSQYFETRSGSNLGGGDQADIAHFGLGTNNIISTLEVKWPTSCGTQILTNVAVNQTINITEALTPSSCDDGIQNGGETGVDCGGPNCAPCATCTDGLQNGNETGVDCGGPDCAPCATCNDGVQNGNETGIDCGGPDCMPCGGGSSCTDGIQNGNETGVDCGGPDCAPCSTGGCTDLTLTIVLDFFGSQTTWAVTDNDNGAVVAMGGPYPNGMSGFNVVENMCLDAGCYTFTIYDSANNGLCCRFGQGSYNLTEDATGITLASGAGFGSSESTSFCVGSSSPLAEGAGSPVTHSESAPGNNQDKEVPVMAHNLTLYPNPVAADEIWVRYDGQSEAFTLRVFDLTGKVVAVVRNLEVSKLDRPLQLSKLGIQHDGLYLFTFTNADEQLVRKVMIK